jgi:hypothetical protein
MSEIRRCNTCKKDFNINPLEIFGTHAYETINDDEVRFILSWWRCHDCRGYNLVKKERMEDIPFVVAPFNQWMRKNITN